MVEKNEFIEENTGLSQNKIVELFSNIANKLITPNERIFEKTRYINEVLVEQLSLCIEEIAKLINAEIWFIADVTTISESKLTNLSEQSQKISKELNSQLILNKSNYIINLNNKITTSEYNLLIINLLRYLDNFPKKVIQTPHESIFDNNVLRVLLALQARDLLIFQEHLLDHHLLICFGNVKDQVEEISIDIYKTPTVKLIESIFRIIIAMVNSSNMAITYEVLVDAAVLRDRGAWKQIAERYIYAILYNLQNSYYKKSNEKRLNIPEYGPDYVVNDEKSDQIISNFLQNKLWDIQNEKYNKLDNYKDLLDLFPIQNDLLLKEYKLDNLFNKLANYQKDKIDNDIMSKFIFIVNIGCFGFYIKSNGKEKKWVPIGNNCVKTHHELFIVYEFINNYLECYLVTSNNKNSLLKDGLVTYSEDNETDIYSKWKTIYKNYQNLFDLYFEKIFNE